jgi:uncharacterized damage-inducible protein DinB
VNVLNEILDLYAYQRWANQRILSAASALPVPAEQLTRDLGSSFPSVLATLAHMLSAQWIWNQRWYGRTPTAIPEEWDLSTAAGVAATWAEVERAEEEFLRTLKEDDVQRIIHSRNLKGVPFATPLWQQLLQVVNHSTYHRGQVVTMLRQLGSPAPSTDLILYYREQTAQTPTIPS